MLVPGPAGGDVLPPLVAVQDPMSLCCIPNGSPSPSFPRLMSLPVLPTWSQALGEHGHRPRGESQCGIVHEHSLTSWPPAPPVKGHCFVSDCSLITAEQLLCARCPDRLLGLGLSPCWAAWRCGGPAVPGRGPSVGTSRGSFLERCQASPSSVGC